MSEEDVIYISWTLLRQHEECKQKSWLVRNGRRTKIRDFKPFYVGTVVDSICRKYLLSAGHFDMVAGVPEMMEETAAKAFSRGDGVLNVSSVQRAEMEEKALKCVTALRPILDDLVLGYEYQPERRFKVPLWVPSRVEGVERRQVVVRGGVDIVVRTSRDPDVYVAYDVKSSPSASYVRSMAGQGVFYDLVQSVEFGAPYEKFAFIAPLVEKQPVLELRVTDEDRRAMAGRIAAMADDIALGLKEPKKGSEGCDYCTVRHSCSKFSPVNLL